MANKKSLSFMSSAIFLAIAAPLLSFLIYSSIYSKNVVISQVSHSNNNLVTMYMNEIDSTLEAVDIKLYYFVNHDADLLSFGLSASSPESEHYYFSKIRLVETFAHDINYIKGVDMFFAYSSVNDDFIKTLQQGATYEKSQRVQKELTALIKDDFRNKLYFSKWSLIKVGEDNYLVRLVQTKQGITLGALVDLQRMMIPLNLIDLGDQGKSLFVSASGEVLTKDEDSPSATKQFNFNKQEDLTIQIGSKKADIQLVVVLPKKNLLKHLTFFQWIIFLLPVATTIILAFFLIILRKVFLKPIYSLIQGMRMIQRGDLEVRLTGDNSMEFDLINGTFNNMVSQIKDLKIHVYEEQLNVQKAEFKHLQAQINPHFFLNSLNIIYTLAEVKNHQLVQQMAMYLAKYFRFITGTNRSNITLAEEMEHISNYLKIQQLRFPQHLTFAVDMNPTLETCMIPALIVQPFIENAMVHGFKMGTEPFHIEIHVGLCLNDSSFFEICIADNGKGFSEWQLNQLQNGDFTYKTDVEHMGIWNVVHRLKLQYGENANITFQNNHEHGACITMWIPIRYSLEQGDREDV